MRNDPVADGANAFTTDSGGCMITFKFSRSMRLICAFGVLTAVTCAANAQSSPNPVLQSTTEAAAPPEGPATGQARPALEPKAIEILKATCARLAGAHSMEFTSWRRTRAQVVWAFRWLMAPNRMCFFRGLTSFA